MRVIVFVKATPSSEAGTMPSTELLTAMGQFNEELVKAGIMVDGAGLRPSRDGVRIRFSGTERTVLPGPFSATNEVVAGYWIWHVKSLEEAIAWAKRCPNPMPEESELEIRPYFEADDFGESFTPELREQEAAQLAMGLGLQRPTFRDSAQRTLVGLQQSYTLQSRQAIPQHWDRFVSQHQNIAGRIGSDYFGVCSNEQPDCSFDYLTGVETSAESTAPAGLSRIELEPRRYVVITHPGHVSSLPQLLETIYSRWLPVSGLHVAPAPWFERYTEEFNPQTGMGGMEIWIPIES